MLINSIIFTLCVFTIALVYIVIKLYFFYKKHCIIQEFEYNKDEFGKQVIYEVIYAHPKRILKPDFLTGDVITNTMDLINYDADFIKDLTINDEQFRVYYRKIKSDDYR